MRVEARGATGKERGALWRGIEPRATAFPPPHQWYALIKEPTMTENE